jgi:hypothetical protein
MEQIRVNISSTASVGRLGKKTGPKSVAVVRPAVRRDVADEDDDWRKTRGEFGAEAKPRLACNTMASRLA